MSGAALARLCLQRGVALPALRSPVLAAVRFAKSNSKDNVPKSKKLFTPGPLNTTATVKQAMLRDLGSRDLEFVQLVKEIRTELLKVSGLSEAEYTTIPVQGSGTYAVESVITCAVPRKGGKLLQITNGAYGHRIGDVAKVLDIDVIKFECPETERPDLAKLEALLASDKSITNVSAVHCETSCGIINPVEEIGKLIHKHNPAAVYFVDAMSSYGGIPLDVKNSHIHFLVSSANKCIQGVPGFSYVIAQRSRLDATKGVSRSLSFDLYLQNQGLDTLGQFRFTPATHAMVAFRQALRELEAEGGVLKRNERYRRNKEVLQKGLNELGFKELLSPEVSSYIITTYHFPTHPNFSFKTFYEKLNERDLVIYPGKVTKADCFRIGNIGDLKPQDMEALVKGIKEVCAEMNIPLPLA